MKTLARLIIAAFIFSGTYVSAEEQSVNMATVTNVREVSESSPSANRSPPERRFARKIMESAVQSWEGLPGELSATSLAEVRAMPP